MVAVLVSQYDGEMVLWLMTTVTVCQVEVDCINAINVVVVINDWMC